MTEVDAMLEQATMVTRDVRHTRIEYARYADDLVILVDGYRRHDWSVTCRGEEDSARSEHGGQALRPS
jgi:RNA-directed DNA polymerase